MMFMARFKIVLVLGAMLVLLFPSGASATSAPGDTGDSMTLAVLQDDIPCC
jgi:hypothetical protein